MSNRKLFTPWGYADTVEDIAPGIKFVSTPSHGGFILSDERKAQVPEHYREYAASWSKGWGDNYYEEDVAALAVLVTFPDVFDTDNIEDAQVMLDYYIDKWQS